MWSPTVVRYVSAAAASISFAHMGRKPARAKPISKPPTPEYSETAVSTSATMPLWHEPAAASTDESFKLQLAMWMTRQREERGVSQELLARAMGHDQPYLSRIEGAERRVSVGDLVRWSVALGVSWEGLANGLRQAWDSSGSPRQSLWSGPTRADW